MAVCCGQNTLLDIRTLGYEIRPVNSGEFLRRARRYARKANLQLRFDPSRGKGSHGLLYLGERRTVVKHGELKPGTLRAMLKQLGIREEDF